MEIDQHQVDGKNFYDLLNFKYCTRLTANTLIWYNKAVRDFNFFVRSGDVV